MAWNKKEMFWLLNLVNKKELWVNFSLRNSHSIFYAYLTELKKAFGNLCRVSWEIITLFLLRTECTRI